MKLAVAIQEEAPTLDREYAAATVAAATELGHDVSLVADGDESAMGAEVLLLISDSPSYVRYPGLLWGRAGRPKVVLWQMHPLPPREIGPVTERVGLLAASVGRPWSSAAYRVCHALMLRQFGWPWTEMDARPLGYMMPRWRWIRRGVRQGWLDRVCVTTAVRAGFLASRGVEASCVPAGSHRLLCEDRKGERDIDVLFLGRPGIGRRAAILERTRVGLERAGVRLVVVDGECFGETRTALLNRVKVLLNINKFAWDPPWVRFILGLGCGAAVVSDTVENLGGHPLKPGEHFTMVSPPELTRAVRAALDDGAQRERQVSTALAVLGGELTMRSAVRKLLDRL